MSASYYAISAKVHALYGKRMTEEDYHQLMERQSIQEAAVFLQTHPGYRTALSGINPITAHRDDLESALRSAYVDEYQKLFSFMNMADKELMRFSMYRAEQSAILATMRHLTSTARLDPVAIWADYFHDNSRLDLASLQDARNFSDIVHAAEHTIYGSTLVQIQATAPDALTSTFVDSMMQATFYARLYRHISRNYKGDTAKILRQSVNHTTDLLNLIQFLRLKRNFSSEDIRRYSFSLPWSSRVTKEYVQQLLSSADYETAFRMIQDGPYCNIFRSITPTGVEAYYYTWQYTFAKQQLRAASPTVYTPFAYLTLKEIELRNIISIIECIRYGGRPADFVTLIGI